jgi:general secretion pathway protein A
MLCDNSIRFPLSCLRDSADTWQEVIALNRPVMLDLVTADRFAAALFLGESSGNALLWSDSGLMRVPFVQLAERWRGGYRLLWRPPEGFSGPVGRSDSGPVVADIAGLFAELDGQTEPLARDTYSPLLAERVRLFQASQQLSADGVVGEQTLLRLNIAAGRDLSAAAALQRLTAGVQAQ